MNKDFIKGLWEPFDISINNEDLVCSQYFDEALKYYYQKSYEKSLNYFQKALKYDSTKIDIHYYLGLIYTRNRDFNQAIVHFYEIINVNSAYYNILHVNHIMAYIYSLQKDYENANLYINKVLDSNPNDLKALSILGYIHYSKKEYQKAKQSYYHLLELDQNNINVYNSLGMIYIDSEEDITKGIELCKKSLKFDPENSFYLDSIGWGYYKLKDHNNAIKYLREAFQKNPDDKEIKSHLKMVLDI